METLNENVPSPPASERYRLYPWGTTSRFGSEGRPSLSDHVIPLDEDINSIPGYNFWPDQIGMTERAVNKL
jgi:hypothetical protein